MSVGRFDLAAFILDLAEQPGVLDGQHGLSSKGLKQIDHFRRKAPRHTAENRQTSHDLLFAKKRNSQQGPVAELSQYRPHSSRAKFSLIENVRHFHRHPSESCLPESATTEMYGACTQRLNKLFLNLVTTPKMKFFRVF